MTTVIEAVPQISRSRHGVTALAGRYLNFPVCVTTVLAVLIYFFVPPTVNDPDIWWHLRDAEFQLNAHAFITQDMFSFTAHGAPWMNHEWLAELPFYFGWRIMGTRGLFFITVFAVEAILLGVFYLSYRKSRSLLSSLVVSVVGAFLSTISFGPRTLLFGWICLVIELLILENLRTHPRLVCTLPLLFCVWVNTHGSWLIGIILLGVFIASDIPQVSMGSIENTPSSPSAQRRLWTAGVLSVPALFLNPYGWRLVAYPFNLAFHQRLNIANIEEWRTLDFHSPRSKVLLISLALLFLSQLLRRRKWAIHEVAFFFIGVYSAFTYSRFLFLAAILIVPLMATDLALLFPARKLVLPTTNRPLLNAILLLALIPLVLRHSVPAGSSRVSSGERFPTQALPTLKNFQPQGNVFNDFLWGGFLIWHTRQIPVLIDSRVDIFEYNGTFRDYLDAVRLKNTLDILDKYKIRYVIFERDTPLIYFLEHTAAWKIDYEDGSTSILERKAADRPRLRN